MKVQTQRPRLHALLKDLVDRSELLACPDFDVSGVSDDSRSIQVGEVFVLLPPATGAGSGGTQYIESADRGGAIAILGEAPAPHGLRAPYFQVKDARQALALVANRYFDYPSRGMTVIGVTGTNGKTTTAHLIEAVLKADHHEVGVIGTISFRYGDKTYDATHTTPGALELQKLLSQMKADGCTAVVMEVSSHALKQRRVAGVAFDAVVFTNLTPEHLDYHPDMEDYFESKLLLFTECVRTSILASKRPFAAVNGDDPYGQRILQKLRESPPPELWFAAYGLGDGVDIHGEKMTWDGRGVQGEAGGTRLKSKLVGKFNAYNILAAAAVGQGLSIPPELIAKGVSSLSAVPGRLESVPNSKGVHVLVDYAHKPEALESVLKAVRESYDKPIHLVFGCGGDRDRVKRPRMGEIAVRLADRVTVTSDNPRSEDPVKIIAEIVSGADGSHKIRILPDRRRAITEAVQAALPGEVVLIAGKGHETYQIVGAQKQPFDDRKVAAEAFGPG